MSYTSPVRPGEGPLPDYHFVPAPPDPARRGITTGCYGCAFRYRSDIRCSRIPCHVGHRKNMVAELIPVK